MLGREFLCQAFKLILVTSSKFLLFLLKARQCSGEFLLTCDELSFQGIPLLRMKSLEMIEAKRLANLRSFALQGF